MKEKERVSPDDLRELIEYYDLYLADVQRLCDVSPRTVYRWLHNGPYMPRIMYEYLSIKLMASGDTVGHKAKK